jgi:hypothetical protein
MLVCVQVLYFRRLTHSAQFEKNQKCLTTAKENECEGEITNYLVVSKKGRLANMHID